MLTEPTTSRSVSDAQIEAVREWFIKTHACWFTVASLREMFAVAHGVTVAYRPKQSKGVVSQRDGEVGGNDA